ncbi:hypothetical protein [Sneathiella glossodoripedis]|uniref:hypothetical protein n=1 Tax=Sneathiella glossodoripedis TaxID=418853 RepID=UPI00046FCFED|nr:hypothetical protein [Sneathiella glossodoripedis]
MKPPQRAFNPWRRAKSESAKTLVQLITKTIEEHEKAQKLRTRKRRAADQLTFENIVEAIIMDITHCHLIGIHQGIHMSFSNSRLGVKSRYRPEVLSQTLPTVVQRLSMPELNYVIFQVGENGKGKSRQQTSVSIGPQLKHLIHEMGLTLQDIDESLDRESIELREPKDRSASSRGQPIEYTDSEMTEALREEMRSINEWLQEADLQLTSNSCSQSANNWINDEERFLKRIFTHGSFESGGRLYGGFWQQLRKTERFEGLTIQGERIAEVDYGQVGLRIAYSFADHHPPSDDLYEIPGLENYRQGIKKLLNAMLFNYGPLRRKPYGTKKMLPVNQSVSSLQEAIIQKHQPIEDLFGTGIGHHIQRIESDILVKVLLKLREEGIVSLPIHDAVLVPRSTVDITSRIMLEEFKGLTGIQGSVSVSVGDD